MKVNVVYGAPCSGKSTYVKDNIGKKDITFDYDLLTRAITHSDTHILDRAISNPIVRAIENVMIAKVKDEYKDRPEVLWYTTRYPEKFVKDKLKGFEVEYIPMKTTKEECYNRLEVDDSRPDKEVWKKKIDEWFTLYGEEERSIRAKQLKALMDRISK